MYKSLHKLPVIGHQLRSLKLMHSIHIALDLHLLRGMKQLIAVIGSEITTTGTRASHVSHYWLCRYFISSYEISILDCAAACLRYPLGMLWPDCAQATANHSGHRPSEYFRQQSLKSEEVHQHTLAIWKWLPFILVVNHAIEVYRIYRSSISPFTISPFVWLLHTFRKSSLLRSYSVPGLGSIVVWLPKLLRMSL